MGYFMGVIYGPTIGEISTCPLSLEEIYATNITILAEKYQADFIKAQEAASFILLLLVAIFLNSSQPWLLTLPREMHALHKEYRNGWYSCLNYYLTKFVADLPLQTLLPSGTTLISCYMTAQPHLAERVWFLVLSSTLSGFGAHAIAEIISGRLGPVRLLQVHAVIIACTCNKKI